RMCKVATKAFFLFGPCNRVAVGGSAAYGCGIPLAGTARFSFGKTQYGAPAAPRAVGRGGAPKPTEWARKCPWGARERAQVSHWGPRHACVVGRAGAAK